MSFDSYAKKWDTDSRIDRAKIIAEAMSKEICIKSEGSAMEFGCGTGLVSFNLIHRFKTIDLFDSSKGMIDILNSKIENYGVTSMKSYHLDITDGSVIHNKYDVIYNSLVLHHIDEVKEVVQQFYDLLNVGGEVCIVDLDEEDGSFHRKYPDFDGHNGFDQRALSKILVEAGFTEIKTSTFYHGEKIINGEVVKYTLFMMIGVKA